MSEFKTEVQLGADTQALQDGMQKALGDMTAAFQQMTQAMSNVSASTKAETEKINSALKTSEDESKKLQQSMASMAKNVESSVKGSFAGLKTSMDSVNSTFMKFSGAFAAVTAVLAGGAEFKAVIGASNEWNSSAVKLSRQLGITTEQASVMNVALSHIGVTSDQYADAAMAMSRQVNNNAQAFEELGVKTQSLNGHMRPAGELMTEVNNKLREIKNPIEQNIAGMQVYGKQWSEIRGILKLTPEAMEDAQKKARDLHLIVGPEGAAQTKMYKEQMADLGLVGKSLEVQFGAALTPIFVKMGAWLGQEGPAMANMFGEALMFLSETGIKIYYTFNALGQLLGGLGAAAVAVAHGEFSEAKSIMGEVSKDIDALQAKANKALADLRKPIASSKAPDTESGPLYDFSKGGGKDPKDPGRVPQWEAELKEWENIQAEKAAAEGKFFSMSSQEEEAYWQKKVALTKAGSTENLAARTKLVEAEKKVLTERFESEVAGYNAGKDAAKTNFDAKMAYAQAELNVTRQMYGEKSKQAIEAAAKVAAVEREQADAVLANQLAGYTAGQAAAKNNLAAKMAYTQAEYDLNKQNFGAESKQATDAAAKVEAVQREMVDQERALQDVKVQADRQAAMSEIDMAERAAKSDYDIKKITLDQLLALEKQFETQRQAMRMQAAQATARMVDPQADPVAYAKAMAAIEALKQQHEAKMQEITLQGVKADDTIWSQLFGGIDTQFSSLMLKFTQGTLTLKSLFTDMAKSILDTMSKVIIDIGVKWALGEDLKNDKTTAGAAYRKAVELAASAQTLAASVAKNLGIAQSEAGVAGAAGTASMAAAPFPLNLSAPAFGASMASVAEGFAVTASAAGGFDIPSGVNPVTQLHQEEMVLPASIANPLREQLAGGGASGGGDTHIHINAMDVRSVQDYFRKNYQTLAPGLKGLARNFTQVMA